MSKVNVKKIAASGLAVTMALGTLSGCGQVKNLGVQQTASVDPRTLPIVPTLTKQEVIDYYAEASNYDTIIVRKNKVYTTRYEEKQVVNQDTRDLIKKYQATTEQYLKVDDYENIVSDKTMRFLTPELYNYMRASLNDKRLSSPEIKSTWITEALGYYFIDVEYQLSAAPTNGEYTNLGPYIGINGAIKHSDYFDTDELDVEYMEIAAKKLNDYYTSKFSDANVQFNKDTGEITYTPPSIDPNLIKASIAEEVLEDPNSAVFGSDTDPAPAAPADPVAPDAPATPSDTPEIDLAPGVEIIDSSDTPAETPTDPDAPATTTPGFGSDSEYEVPVTPYEIYTGEETNQVYESRHAIMDIDFFHSVVGYGKSPSYIPTPLNRIWKAPAQDGASINGIGLYPCGNLGFKLFGYDRESLTGTCIIRYVYKQDLIDPSLLEIENIFYKYYEVDNGFNANNDNNIPDFLYTEFKSLVDRADRAMVNNDITGLASSHLFYDNGMAVLNGYFENNANLLRQISTLRRIIQRDAKSNAYLVEIETFRQEGASSADKYASYIDQAYLVIEQHGSEFLITDWIILNRQLVSEPDISPYSSKAKRIVALGLAGEVPEYTREEIRQDIADLYTACNAKWLSGTTTIKDENGAERQIKGLRDHFNTNPEMLPSTYRESIINRIINQVSKYGNVASSNIKGEIIEWLGGTEKQVEFITTEVYTYQGRSTVITDTVYYLMSCIEDVWVIDDVQVLEHIESD